MLKVMVIAGLAVAGASLGDDLGLPHAIAVGSPVAAGAPKYKRIGCSCAHKAQGVATCVRDEPVGESADHAPN